MSISKDDLLADPLLPSLIEEANPALTLSELFKTERVVLGAIKSQVGDMFHHSDKSEDVPTGKQDLNQVSNTELYPTVAVPRFDFEDPFKNILALNAWNQMEYRLASGGSMNYGEDVFDNIRFVLKLNMAIYDKLPHNNFIGFQPMDHQCQLVYHNEFTPIQCGVEKLERLETKNSVETYSIEAETKRLKTSVTNEAMLDMHSMNCLDIKEELIEIASYNISGEMYNEMVGKIVNEAGTSTFTAADNTLPSSLDIIAAIHEASDEISKSSASSQRANWIIMSPQMAAILLSDKTVIDTSVREEAPHVSLIGSLYGMNVFMDTEGAIKANDILVGHKGKHAFTQGMAFCPHTLALDSGSVVNPMTFNTVNSFITQNDYFTPRDAKNYFHKIEFKESPVDYKGQCEMDAGYFYCPYIPQITTDTVINEDDFPTEITFNSDGTRMYVPGNDSDSVYQYHLSTPWVVSTASAIAVPEEDLIDIILPFGAPEKKTIAELFSKRIET